MIKARAIFVRAFCCIIGSSYHAPMMELVAISLLYDRFIFRSWFLYSVDFDWLVYPEWSS